MGKTNESVKLSSILSDIAAAFTDTVHKFSRHECAARAAALAYHLLFSLFPLLLFLVFLGGQFLQGANVKEVLFPYLETAMPAIAGNVERIVEQTLEARDSIGVIGGLCFYGARPAFSAY